MEYDLILDELFKLLQKYYPTLAIEKHPPYTNHLSKSYWFEIKLPTSLYRLDVLIENNDIVIWQSSNCEWIHIPVSDPNCFKQFLSCIKTLIHRDKNDNFSKFDTN